MSLSTAYRTHTCNELRPEHDGQTVTLAGQVHRLRDHGGVLFIDLRDHYGITQVVINPNLNPALYETASTLKPESVVFLEGAVAKRQKSNPKIDTGEIEIQCSALTIDSIVPELPFSVADEQKLPEELRLTHRYLDLRRERLHRNIHLRSRVIAETRNYFHARDFMEFQTPILTVSSPEGARDFLVPSRVNPGKFYALPQAPQQYKQLVICSGFDRYFQIAPCFRDEDARADRTPGEFYQVDVEMAYISQEDLFEVMEGLFVHLAKEVIGREVAAPFPRITFRDAIDRYGSDKPDTRYEMFLTDVTDIFAKSKFKVFSSNAKPGHCVKAIVLPDSADSPRSFFDKLEEMVKGFGAKGLAYIAMSTNGIKSPIKKFLSEEEIANLTKTLDLKTGDTVFFGAGKWLSTCLILGQVRRHLADTRGMAPDGLLEFCWVTDFPMYEWDEEEQKVIFSHNPFSMPQGGLDALNEKDPLEILAYQYDLVCNGIELSSGAIRNHRPDVMLRAFEIAGYSKEELEAKFGHMLNAFRHGAPPHGGIAPGVDRIVMILANEPNIREVIMFPMNQKAQELMTGTPAPVSAQQLKDLHLKLDLKPDKNS